MREETLVKNLLKYERMFRGMITAMVGSPATADDLFQEVAVIMIRKRRQITEEYKFAAWGRAIAVNVVRDYRKKSGRQKVRFLDNKALESVVEVFKNTDKSMWDSRRKALEECSEMLPQRQRGVLNLKYEKDVPVNKLAAMLSMTRGAMDTMLYRIRKALLECVEIKLRSWGIS